MKSKIIFLSLTVLLSTTQLKAKKPQKVVKYRRSSLAMILIETKSFPNKDIVMDAWNNHPFPDKYNDQSVGINAMNPDEFTINYKDLQQAGLKHKKKTQPKRNKKPSKAKKKPGKKHNKKTWWAKRGKTPAARPKKQKFSLKQFKLGKTKDKSIKQMPIKIQKFIDKEDLAKKLVSKWFDRKPDGSFDMKLIEKRGFYNASEMDAAVARGQIRGLASLGDAGEHLINNTFVTFSKVVFLPNEVIARGIRDAAIVLIKQEISGPLKQRVAIMAANLAYKKAKEGYSVWTHTWLYKLNWNDSIATIFYTKLWNNKEAFDTTHLFTMKYVGMESSRSLVTFSIKKGQAKRTKKEIIDLATGRNIDRVFAKLQKNYDVFKPKVPVLTTEPITAQIGLKEGIKPGDKFEVLQMEMDTTTGLTKYVKVGRVSVSKKFPIWDDRYNAGQEPEANHDKHGKSAPKVMATTFEGPSKVLPGMLLVQIK